MPDWVTIQEAVDLARQRGNESLTISDIYRHALSGNIYLSIYFQSPVILKKIQFSNNKVKLRPVDNSPIHQLCLVDHNCFQRGRNLIISTGDEAISPIQMVIDTTLAGYEYVLVQRLLARTLNIPSPIKGANEINHGISVFLYGNLFILLEKITWMERFEKQTRRLPQDITPNIHEHFLSQNKGKYAYFPIYELPRDACFVIRRTELEKIIELPIKNKTSPSSSIRISTPLSRLFWLSCRNNEAISPLINKPYKLLSIFEQWASADGITDHLSGDTLKTALERGSPTST
ncbi:TPA: hypothetical protein ACW0SM_002503 [Raoultella ornithinolytica]